MVPENIYEKMKVTSLYIIGELDGEKNLGWKSYPLQNEYPLRDKEDYYIVELERYNRKITYIFSISDISGILEGIVIKEPDSGRWRSFGLIHPLIIEGGEELFDAMAIGFADSIIERFHNCRTNLKLKVIGGNYNGED